MEWIPVGRLGKTHGLKGEVKFHPDGLDLDALQRLCQVRLDGDPPTRSPRKIAGVRGHGDRLILKFEGVGQVEEARALSGQTLLVRRQDLPPLPAGEYRWFEIQGLRVYDEAGKYYGTVTEILVTGGNDVYVVRDGPRELLLPMIDSVVKQIDLKDRRLIFHIVEGLLEDHPV
ncbi:MAG: ribosome maturation factor RimM [Nitrospinaceae bacterium]